MFSEAKACSTRFPGGNLVDGLPPVASNTGQDQIGQRQKIIMCRGSTFDRRQLCAALSDRARALPGINYTYELNSVQSACP